MTICLEKLVNSRIHENSRATITTVIPLSLGSDQDSPAALMRIFNSVIVDSVIAHLEQLTDSRTMQALEYHQTNKSMSQLCRRPQKISDSLYYIFGDSAEIIVDKIIECVFKSLGYNWVNESQSYEKRRKLADSFATLKRMVLDANNIPR